MFFSAKAFLILAIVTAKIVCLSFLVSCTNRVALITRIFRVLSKLRLSIVFLFSFRFSIKYRVSVRFRLRFFKYPFYSRILVYLVLLCTKLKLLLV